MYRRGLLNTMMHNLTAFVYRAHYHKTIIISLLLFVFLEIEPIIFDTRT